MDHRTELEVLQRYMNEVAVRRLEEDSNRRILRELVHDYHFMAFNTNKWSIDDIPWWVRAKSHKMELQRKTNRAMTREEVARFQATAAIPGWSDPISSLSTINSPQHHLLGQPGSHSAADKAANHDQRVHTTPAPPISPTSPVQPSTRAQLKSRNAEYLFRYGTESAGDTSTSPSGSTARGEDTQSTTPTSQESRITGTATSSACVRQKRNPIPLKGLPDGVSRRRNSLPCLSD
ncbi:hypothetical protein SCAR479_08708 [Seiridium cardinale]|uniref:Clr5 domain-containing protein n=1 Tax=Seiridium cardinale TaxID=138064 RepID=A0ABR2XLC2_9PEZI